MCSTTGIVVICMAVTVAQFTRYYCHILGVSVWHFMRVGGRADFLCSFPSQKLWIRTVFNDAACMPVFFKYSGKQ